MANFLAIPPGRLAANGFGQYQPVNLDDTAEARAQNLAEQRQLRREVRMGQHRTGTNLRTHFCGIYWGRLEREINAPIRMLSKVDRDEAEPDPDMICQGLAQAFADAVRAETQADLKAAQVNLDRTVIRAPISGVIGSVATQEGETVTGELAIEGQTTDFEGTFTEGTLVMTGSSPDLGAITLEATVEGDDMTGSLGLGAMGAADFTGKRNPGTAASERRVER